MVDIDERVVQLKFDSSDFDRNTKSTMSTLDKLQEKLSFKDVVDNDAMNSIVDNVQKVADKAYTIVDRVIDKIKDNIANKLVNYLQVNTIGQLQAGWSKYADMTTSVATLKAQGYAMEDINEQLERLMYFTDETSYKFTDMVGEIGKFTASGQKLEDATKAMMGIADWAALSGKNANEASRAMYQLSQALGAGYIRLQDWKSIQTLNMDTKEFREKALEAAEAVGTVKKNIDGTYKSLVGDKKAFNIQNFSETLSKGQWFTTEVMMKVFGEYADAVDEIREIYLDNQEEIPTAQIINDVKESNEELIEKFNQVNFKGTRKDITDIISRWKKVEKVTAETAEEYAAINDLTVEQAKLQMAEKNNGYAEYLKEYGQIFSGTVEDAEAALDDWHNYISEFGIKAFQSGQEAKTFLEAIESAKDAASTVWTNIYTTIFGDYNEAKEIWTHLANNLYDIFVGRLWSVADIFDYWKNGEKEALTEPLEEYEKELAILKRKEGFNIISDEEKDRIIKLQGYIDELNYQIENKLYRNGRRMFMQGAEAIGAALKFNITQIREAWDSLFDDNESAIKLLDWTERFRLAAYKFSVMIMDPEKGLASTDFYKNIAQGIMNLTAPIRALRSIIKSVIGEFVPAGTTFIDILVRLSEGFKNITAKIVPSQQTIVNLARVLRGIIATIKLLGKAALGLYVTIIRPIVSAIWELVSGIASNIIAVFAEFGDAIYEFEEGLDYLEAMEAVGKALKYVFENVLGVVADLVGFLLRGLAPIINFVISLVAELIKKIKNLGSGDNVKGIKGIGDALGDMAKRAKDAWHSTYSLSDVWNHYKGGSGLSNFIMMLGDMFDVLVTKIGVTIAAIFGFEKETAEGGMVTALDKVRAVAMKTFEIISWLYTNVLRPVLGTVLQGIGAMIKNLGQSFREGDIKGVLSTIKEIISTFTSLQLFKMLQVITKVFGSGGLLRLMRNGAKALKGLWALWGSEAIENISNALFKLAFTIVMVAAALAALTFLPTDNLKQMNKMMISFVVVMAVVLGMVIALTALADNATWGLLTMAFAFTAITAMVVVFMIAAKKLHDYLENLFKDENGGIFGGLVSILAPFLSVVTTILLIITAIKKVGGGNAITFALGFVGIFVAVNNIVNSMVNLIEMLRHYSVGEVLGAAAILISMFALLSLCVRMIGGKSGITVVGEKAGLQSGISSGIAMAIAIATIALVIRMILIPTLDTLLDNMGRWPDYVAALFIIVSAMIAIAYSMKLMNTTIQGGFLSGMGQLVSTIATMLLLSVFVNIIKEDLIPLIMSFADIQINEGTVFGLIAVGSLIMLTAVALRIILEGITRAFLALASINWKPIMSLVLTIGLIVAGIIALNAILEQNNIEIETETILIILGAIAGVLVALGIFAVVMSKTFKGSASGNSMTSLSKILKQFALMLGVIILGLVAVLAEIALLYKDDNGTALLNIGVYLGALVLAVAAIFFAFSKMVSSIMTSIGKGAVSASRMAAIEGIMKQIKNILIVIIAGMAGILLESKLFDKPMDMIWPLLVFVGGVAAIILSISFGFSKLLDDLSWIGEKVTPERIKALTSMLKVIVYGVIGIMAAIAIGTIVMTAFAGDNIDQIWIPALTMVASVCVELLVILEVLALFLNQTNTLGLTKAKMEQLSKVLLIVAAFAGIMSIIMAGILGALSNTSGENNIANAVAILISVVGVFAGLVIVISAVGKGASSFDAAATVIASGIAKIAGALLFLGVAVDVLKSAFGLGKTIAEKLNDGFQEGADINSPSEEFKKDGKYIDQGLALGLKKNTYLATNASKALAVATNTAFQKELKIASPSKVFYENGKFVIRGFINGANSEYQKNKDIGAAIGEGFAESAMEGITDEFEKLWTDSGMLEDMKEALDGVGEEIGSDMGKSLFSALLGEEEEAVSDLELEQKLNDKLANDPEFAKEYSRLQGEITKAKEEYEELLEQGRISEGGMWSDSTYWSKEATLSGNIEKAQKNFDNFVNGFINPKNAKKAKKGIAGIFSLDNLGDSFTEIGDKLGGIFSGSFTDSFGSFFSENGIGLTSITTAFTNAGTEGGNSFLSSIFGVFGADPTTGKLGTGNKFSLMGRSIGEGITDGLSQTLLIGFEDLLLKNPLVKGVAVVAHMAGLIDDETFMYITGKKPPNYDKNKTVEKYQAKVNEGISPLLNTSDKNTYSRAQIKQDMMNRYIENNWEHFQDMDDERFAIFVDNYTKYINSIFDEYENDIKKYGLTPDYDTSGWFKSYYLKLINSTNAMSGQNFIWEEKGWRDTGITDDDRKELEEYHNKYDEVLEDHFEHAKSKINKQELKNKIAQLGDEKLAEEMLTISNMDMDVIWDYLVGHYLISGSRLKKVKEEGSFAGSDLSIFDENGRNITGYFDTLARQYNMSGENLIRMLFEGMARGYLDYDMENKIFRIIDEDSYAQLKRWMEGFEQASPSKATARIAKNNLEGFAIGTDDNVKLALDSIDDATDLITEETIAGLNGMTSMLDKEITPTVTPVFDSVELQNGVSQINSAVDSMQPRVDAAIGSFGVETRDYGNDFTSLANRIDSLTGVVNSFMSLIEGGAGIDVHVTAEADPNNIYNLVVDENRREWKRTGRNNLAW